LIVVVIGLNICGGERLPLKGPAIIVANHNSHLDTLTLLSLWPLSALHRVRLVAAADYFLSNSALDWFSLNVMRILPIDRQRNDAHGDPLVDMSEALSSSSAKSSAGRLSKMRNSISSRWPPG
jgi:1-acyl-sn-glycerol-3-phosphate acyltransferase